MPNVRADVQAFVHSEIRNVLARVHTWGKVTATSPLTVLLNDDADDGEVVVALRDGSYTPAVDDLVRLGRYGADWIIEGQFVEA